MTAVSLRRFRDKPAAAFRRPGRRCVRCGAAIEDRPRKLYCAPCKDIRHEETVRANRARYRQALIDARRHEQGGG